jgi:APA family basic amino acid/polyamine antiporter
MSGEKLQRTIGLFTATFIIIGYVVGATIFILPGSLAAEAGPAIFAAYGMAAIPAIIAGFVYAQVGAAIAVSGANFILLRDALSPIFGFLYLWIVIWLAAVVIPLIAYGFADYLAYFQVGINPDLVAVLVTIAFVVFNGLGMRVAASVQNGLVAMLLLALAIFGIGGVAQGNPDLLQPLLPEGFAPLVMAAITASFSYAGIIVITEIAGEIKDPGKNIPRAVLLGFGVIIALYLLVPLSLSMLLPWQELGNSKLPVVTAAQTFLPEPVVAFIAVAALLAAATSINGVMMGFSRDIFQGATCGLFPVWLAEITPSTQTPSRAVMLVGALSLAGILAGGTIIKYAQLALIGLMLINILSGVALMRFPRYMPATYQQSTFRLSRPALYILGFAHIAFSVLFLWLLSAENPEFLAVGFLFLFAGAVYYQVRRHFGIRELSI